MTNLKSLSDMLGIAPSTISRVLNNNPGQRISQPKRQLILDAAKRHNYRPSQAARSLVKQKTSMVAMVLHYGFSAEAVMNVTPMMGMMMALESTLREYHYGLGVVFVSRDNPLGSFKKLITTYRSFDALLFGAGIASREMVEMAAEHNIPTAVVNESRADDWPVNYFHVDEVGDIDRAVEHLVQIGHKEIGVIGWDRPGRLAPGTFSREAYDSLHRRGLVVPEEWVVTVDPRVDPFYSHRDHGRDAMDRILDGTKRPTAVITRSDLMAYGVMDAMRQRGLRIGKDIALVGHGNLEQVLHGVKCPPVLTTFENPCGALGQAAAEALIRKIDNDEEKLVFKLYPSQLIVRDSTAC